MGSDDEKPYAKNYIAKVRSTWEKLEKLEDGKSKIFSFKMDVKPGYYLLCSCGCQG